MASHPIGHCGQVKWRVGQRVTELILRTVEFVEVVMKCPQGLELL